MALPASDEAIHNDHKTYENTDIDALTQLSQPTETLNIDKTYRVAQIIPSPGSSFRATAHDLPRGHYIR